MLKLNVNGKSFAVEGYTRSPMAQINFYSSLVIGEQSSLKFLSELINSKQTQKLAIRISTVDECRYECEMTSFEPVYETLHEAENWRIAKAYDFRIGFGHHALCCEHIDIELRPVRHGYLSGILKCKIWFIDDDQGISDLTPPWSLMLEYYNNVSKTWSPVFTGWELRADDDINSQSLSLNGQIKGAQIVTPLSAILL